LRITTATAVTVCSCWWCWR